MLLGISAVLACLGAYTLWRLREAHNITMLRFAACFAIVLLPAHFIWPKLAFLDERWATSLEASLLVLCVLLFRIAPKRKETKRPNI